MSENVCKCYAVYAENVCASIMQFLLTISCHYLFVLSDFAIFFLNDPKFLYFVQDYNSRVLEGFQVSPIWHQGFIRDNERHGIQLEYSRLLLLLLC